MVGFARCPIPLGRVKIARDNMGWRGYLCVEPVHSDRDHETESNAAAGGWGTLAMTVSDLVAPVRSATER